MSNLSSTLRGLRIEYGFDSARRFYESIAKKGEKAFNYPYYVRLEKGSSHPSSKVLRALLQHFNKKDQEKLIYSWCQDNFTDHSYLFKLAPQLTQKKGNVNPAEASPNTLSLSQISVLAENKTNYFVFLLVTLSRYKVAISDISQFFNPTRLAKSLSQLESYQLVIIDEGCLSAPVMDRVFPPPQSDKLRTVYKKFDLWDSEISKHFQFQDIITRKFIRRVSYRYISLIESHLDLIFKFIRSAGEVEKEQNNHVIQMHVQLSQGELPG